MRVTLQELLILGCQLLKHTLSCLFIRQESPRVLEAFHDLVCSLVIHRDVVQFERRVDYLFLDVRRHSKKFGYIRQTFSVTFWHICSTYKTTMRTGRCQTKDRIVSVPLIHRRTTCHIVNHGISKQITRQTQYWIASRTRITILKM